MSQKKGLGERVVKDLTREIWGENHHVYCDNYFTSTDLFQELLENGTYACGTIRTNRKGLPPAVSKAKLRRQGEMVQQQNHSMVATAWHDKRTVTLLSTNADPREMTEVQRKQKDGSIVNVRCPKILKLYTQNMNGVDRADQLRSTYSICRKAAKWWKYLFWFMVDVAICNAFILMKDPHSKRKWHFSILFPFIQHFLAIFHFKNIFPTFLYLSIFQNHFLTTIKKPFFLENAFQMVNWHHFISIYLSKWGENACFTIHFA